MLYSQKTKETLEIIVFNCSRGNLFLQFKYLQLQSLVLNSTSSVTLLANMLNNLTWLYHPIPRITMSVRWFVPCPFFTPSNTHTHTHPSIQCDNIFNVHIWFGESSICLGECPISCNHALLNLNIFKSNVCVYITCSLLTHEGRESYGLTAQREWRTMWRGLYRAATRSRDPRLLVKYDDANMRLLPQLSTRSAAKMVFRYFLFEKYKWHSFKSVTRHWSVLKEFHFLAIGPNWVSLKSLNFHIPKSIVIG